MREALAAAWLLEQQAQGLLGRLAILKPFALQESMVPAAAISPQGLQAIDMHMQRVKRRTERTVRRFMASLQALRRGMVSPRSAQRVFALLRLRVNSVLSQFDIFSDALTQRSETGTGVWLAGLDELAGDALRIPGFEREIPELACYLDASIGAAIRRARTRLPGGDGNPIAIIRVPRERMVGSAIAGSICHEVGHQAAAILGLALPSRTLLHAEAQADAANRAAWTLWERYVGEVLADFWSIGHVGPAAVLGLTQVLSLPRPFVFRVDMEDPHPAPWIRVQLACRAGEFLYPDPQWRALARVWESLYPMSSAPEEYRALLDALMRTLPKMLLLLMQMRPPRLEGRSLASVLYHPDRSPRHLRAAFAQLQGRPGPQALSPAVAVAVLAQGKLDGQLSETAESTRLRALLVHFALKRPQRIAPAVRLGLTSSFSLAYT